MKRIELLLGAALLAALLGSCGEDYYGNVRDFLNVQISPMELKFMIDHKSDFVLIDMRIPNAYDRGHIAGAINIMFINLDRMKYQYPYSKTIIVYNQTLENESDAVKKLKEMGYKDIRYLNGGFAAWFNDGLEMETQ